MSFLRCTIIDSVDSLVIVSTAVQAVQLTLVNLIGNHLLTGLNVSGSGNRSVSLWLQYGDSISR